MDLGIDIMTKDQPETYIIFLNSVSILLSLK